MKKELTLLQFLRSELNCGLYIDSRTTGYRIKPHCSFILKSTQNRLVSKLNKIEGVTATIEELNIYSLRDRRMMSGRSGINKTYKQLIIRTTVRPSSIIIK